jgi:Tetratricopeptide repeat
MTVEAMLDAAFAHHQAGRLPEAEILYRDAIEADPQRWGACLNLTKILMLTGRVEQAQRWLRWRLEDSPEDATAHRQLGFSYASQNQLGLALRHFQSAIEQDPRDAGAHEVVAHLLRGFGHVEEAKANFERSAALRDPVRIGRALGDKPRFRVLMLFAPGAGNTPFMEMLRVVTYDVHMLSVVTGVDYDAESLAASTDVVFNLIGDVDNAGYLLETAAQLIARIGKPVVNHPDYIAMTGRQSISERFAPIADCIAPPTRRYSTDEMRRALSGGNPGLLADPGAYPLLVRRAGTHGGKDFEKVDDLAAVRAFVEQTAAPCYYVSKYVDYRSADGYFRKYRFMFVDGDILPYHLAIDDKWMVHHATTDMLNQPWMQDEERTFLDAPHTVFGERQYAVLRAIRDAIGLRYWGIDCALDCEGSVVVFEANATMLVHTRNGPFPYKRPAVAQIKRAYDAMLERLAGISGPAKRAS